MKIATGVRKKKRIGGMKEMGTIFVHESKLYLHDCLLSEMMYDANDTADCFFCWNGFSY